MKVVPFIRTDYDAGTDTPAGAVGIGTPISAGDLSGSHGVPIVSGIGGVSVSGTPTAGEVLTATSGTAADWAAPAFANPMTTAADLIVGGTGGAPIRLAKGADSQVLTVDPTTHLLVWATPGSGGGSGPAGKVPVQDKATGSGSNTNALAITLGSAPTSGNLLIACIDRDATGAISNITQTNVTWSLLVSSGNGTAPVVEIWKGVVAASASASLTINCATTTYMGAVISEWNGVTGTLDQSAVLSGQASNLGGSANGTTMRTPVLLPTQTNALVIGAMSSNSNSGLYRAISGLVAFDSLVATGAEVECGFAFPGTTPVRGVYYAAGGISLSATFSAAIVSIT